MTDKKIAARVMTERKVIRAFVSRVLSEGLTISVCDGEATVLSRSPSTHDVMRSLMSTDEDILTVWDGSKRIGSLFLVYGNDGYDVVNDYTTTLEPYMTECNAVAEKEEARR